ncbi:hypothetical protein CFP56_027773, partial [Quercus suber]
KNNFSGYFVTSGEQQVKATEEAWIKNFNEIPAIKESLRDRNELLTYFKWLREHFVSSAVS